MKKNLLILILLFISCSNTESEVSSQTTTSLVELEITTTTTTTIFEQPYKHNFIQVEGCKDFLGSEHKTSCVKTSEIKKIFEFNNPIVNLAKSRNREFAISKHGYVYELNFETGDFEIVFDIFGSVNLESLESGLLSFALHPNKNQFLISYVDLSNNLIFELYYFDGSLKNVTSSKVLLSVKILSNSHYSGGIIWSDYFQAYLVSVGDGVEANFESRLNHMPLDTNYLYGKILAISENNENKQISSLVLSDSNENINQNIVAIGLRNPWQFFEFNDYLVVADTGFTQNEELNIVKYSNSTPVFGWPVFEATKRSEDLDNIENYSLDKNIYFWSKDEKISGLNYIEGNSTMPAFYYNHHPCNSEFDENCDGQTNIYRAAIIGGDILNNASSKYNFDIFFADYLSQELFSLNLISRELKIFPIEGVSNVTSVRTSSNQKDEIIVTTYNGEIYLVSLP